jgi:hypothetical protein
MLKAFYGTLAKGELSEFIRPGGFASKITRMLGAEINSTLEILEEEDGEQWGIDPVHDLYFMLKSGWNLDHEWFMWTDNLYRDDNEQVLPDDMPKTYTTAEQMAAYGLHLLNVEMHAAGPAPESGENDQGWTREGVLYHEAACLIRANQAVTYAVRLQAFQADSPAPEDVRAKFSALGLHRVEKKNAYLRKAKDFTLAEWQKYGATEYGNNKSAFARHYRNLISHKFKRADGVTPLFVTEGTIKNDWLP